MKERFDSRDNRRSRRSSDPTSEQLRDLEQIVANFSRQPNQEATPDVEPAAPSRRPAYAGYGDEDFPLQVNVIPNRNNDYGTFNVPNITRQAEWYGLRGNVSLMEALGKPTLGVAYAQPIGPNRRVGPSEVRSWDVHIGQYAETTISIYPELIRREIRRTEKNEKKHLGQTIRRVNEATNNGLVEGAKEQILWKDDYLNNYFGIARKIRLAGYGIGAAAAGYTTFTSVILNQGLSMDQASLITAGCAVILPIIGWAADSYMKAALQPVKEDTGYFNKNIERYPLIEGAILGTKVLYEKAKKLFWSGAAPRLYTKSPKN